MRGSTVRNSLALVVALFKSILGRRAYRAARTPSQCMTARHRGREPDPAIHVMESNSAKERHGSMETPR